MAKLGKDDIVTIHVLKDKGESNSRIARVLGVTEGAVRYHLRRRDQGCEDGRKKRSLIEQEGLSEVAASWWSDQLAALPPDRSPNASALWAMLVRDYHYCGSAKSVRKYARTHLTRRRLRPYRRIETPPGAQTQSDWLESCIDIGSGPETLYGFLMVLSHSRKTALVWSRSMDQLNWHRVHNEAFVRIGGIAAVNRIDNLKTGVSRGAGSWGVINASYRAYAQLMGFHVDPHEPHAPHQKGKAERGVGWVKGLGLSDLCFDGLEHLQAYTDQKILQHEQRRVCPATGQTIAETWQQEKMLLRELPALLPQPFDVIRDCPVHKDCTIRFEGRTYAVPFRYVGQRLEARGCAQVVQIVDPKRGQIVQEYPRGTDSRVLIDQHCYEGDTTDAVIRPKPLGKISRALQMIMDQTPQVRSVDLYAKLAEVSR